MSLPSPKICRRIRALFAAIASVNKHEADQAREKLLKLLVEHGLNWSEIPACIAAADEDDRVRAGQAHQRQPHGSPASATSSDVNALELVLYLIERHIAITPEE